MADNELLAIRDKIIELCGEVSLICNQQKELVKELERKCNHESVIECEYRPESIIFDAQPPERRCIICGLMEDAWGDSWQVLTATPIKTVSRDKIYVDIWKPIVSVLASID